MPCQRRLARSWSIPLPDPSRGAASSSSDDPRARRIGLGAGAQRCDGRQAASRFAEGVRASPGGGAAAAGSLTAVHGWQQRWRTGGEQALGLQRTGRDACRLDKPRLRRLADALEAAWRRSAAPHGTLSCVTAPEGVQAEVRSPPIPPPPEERASEAASCLHSSTPSSRSTRLAVSSCTRNPRRPGWGAFSTTVDRPGRGAESGRSVPDGAAAGLPTGLAAESEGGPREAGAVRLPAFCLMSLEPVP